MGDHEDFQSIDKAESVNEDIYESLGSQEYNADNLPSDAYHNGEISTSLDGKEIGELLD